MLQDESGQDLIEYALVTELIGFSAITSMQSIGNSVDNIFSAVNSDLTSALESRENVVESALPVAVAAIGQL